MGKRSAAAESRPATPVPVKYRDAPEDQTEPATYTQLNKLNTTPKHILPMPVFITTFHHCAQNFFINQDFPKNVCSSYSFYSGIFGQLWGLKLI
jgi:hypothetical protein